MSDLTRREFSKRMAAGIGGSALFQPSVFSSTRSAGPPEQPNIVFICSDQHSYRYTGYAGHEFVETPHLDRIARQGVIFENAYTGAPVCVPGRSCMMTGTYPSDCNSFGNSTVWDGSHPTWGTRLQEVGYYTRATGKMDIDPSKGIGFEEVDTSHGHITGPDITELFRRPVGYRMGERPNVDGRPRDDRHSDQGHAQNTAEFIREEGIEMDQPWATYIGFSQPHPSFVALQKYYERFYPNRVDMPNIPPGHLESQHLMFQELRRFKRIATPIPDERIRRARAGYYGMVKELDEYIGQLWNVLEETGQLKNTVFIYTSDHGEMLGAHGLWYKNNLYEDGAHIPLVVAGAGIPNDVTVDTPVAHVDLIYTMLEWAGAETPSELRGHSLTPLMNGDRGHHPGFSYSESHSEGNCTGSFMIRKGDWKYLHFTWYDDLLFNLEEDPNEFTNRIDDPATEDIRQELEDILREEIDPDEVTRRAFATQERFLADMSDRLGEEGLFEALRRRLGDGQARALAARHAG